MKKTITEVENAIENRIAELEEEYLSLIHI